MQARGITGLAAVEAVGHNRLGRIVALLCTTYESTLHQNR
jgi:hypothetical protein